MTKSFVDFLDEIISIIDRERDCEILFFRGHSCNQWSLLPSLLRNGDKSLNYFEQALYYDFISNAGSLLGSVNKKSWELIFLMQHNGLPTRLLDWSENFATALFFALDSNEVSDPEIWILNPIKLNKKTKNIGAAIINPDLDLYHDYYQTHIEKIKNSDRENPIAIYPHRENHRLFNQKGLFTLHGTSIEPLEKIAPECLHKIKIPTDCIEDAKKFLELSGINSYSIYNDLESLAKHLKKKLNF